MFEIKDWRFWKRNERDDLRLWWEGGPTAEVKEVSVATPKKLNLADERSQLYFYRYLDAL